jgi:hypothetical protein
MGFINGYKYTTETEAIAAQSACDSYYGVPLHPDDITQHWCGYNFAELNDPQFWYITYDISLVPVLGEPTEFEVIQPPFPES